MNFLRNPIFLIVVGILLLGAGGIGVIPLIIGIVIFIKEKKTIAANEDLFFEIAVLLEKNGYKTQPNEQKRNIISAFVSMNDKWLGVVFLVAPGQQYSELREIVSTWKQEFNKEYSAKFGKSPDIPLSYWPTDSLIGAYISTPFIENISEKGEFMSRFGGIYQERLSK